MALNTVDIDVEVKLSVPDETVRACFWLLRTNCENRLRDLPPSSHTCYGCPLLHDTYCEYKQEDI